MDHCYRVIHQTDASDPDHRRARSLREKIHGQRRDAAVQTVRKLRRIPDPVDDPEALDHCLTVTHSCGPARATGRSPLDDEDYRRAVLLLEERRARVAHREALDRLRRGLRELDGKPIKKVP